MKAVDFDYVRPATIGEAVELLAGPHGVNAKLMAGGQTLGPMLNLRFAQPDLVIDVTRIVELGRIEESDERTTYGACVTHAAIEDGRVPDRTRGMMTRVAHGIAYRAVRTRGTIGGSLAHADPAADWLSCLLALDASVAISGPRGARAMPLDRFVRGVMETALAADEIIDGVTVPHLGPGARWGYHKICRKTGEFADAIGAVVIDRDRCRIIAGATTGLPLLFERPAAEALADPVKTIDSMADLYRTSYPDDHYAFKVHVACVRRALDQARTA